MKHILLSLSISTLLVACGSSSGGGSGSLPGHNAHQPAANMPVAAVFTPKAAKMSLLGGASTRPVDYSYNLGKDNFGRDVYTVNIEGKKIKIFHDSTFTTSDSDYVLRNSQVLNGLSNEIKFYQLTKGNQTNGSYRFYVGEYARDMPTSGTVKYNGRYKLTALDTNSPGNGSHYERLSFTANFSDKSLVGTIKDADFSGVKSNINLRGNIRHNQFSGTAKINDAVKRIGYRDAVMNGGFFGYKGKTAGGMMIQDGGNNKQTWIADFYGKAH